MSRIILIILGLLTCLGLPAAGSFAQKPGTSPPLSLRVTVESYNSNGSLCQILPDSGGEYIDGEQGVIAFFDKYGNFYFKFASGMTPRSVQINYASPFLLPSPPPPDDPPFGVHTVEFVTFKSGDPYVNLQDMQVGNDKCQCLGTGWTLDTYKSNNVTWNNNFHRAGSFFHDDRTSYAVVTCVEADGKCTRWEIEPKKTYLDASGQPVTIACNNTTGQVESVASVVKIEGARNRKTVTNYGLYEMAFKLTLRKK